MQSYKELQDQIAELQRKAEEVRKQEIASVIAEIKSKMADFGITLSDLGAPGKGRKGGKKPAAPGTYKYRNPATGETWTGRGRKPQWLVNALTAGKNQEDYLA